MTTATGANEGARASGYSEPAPRMQSAPASHGPGVMGEISGAFSAAQRAVSGYVDLIVLEARRAGMSLIWMVALGFGAAILGVTAWMGLSLMLALWIMELGLSPILAVLIVVVANLAGAAGAVYACIKFSKDLMFTASRRQLSGHASPPADA